MLFTQDLIEVWIGHDVVAAISPICVIRIWS